MIVFKGQAITQDSVAKEFSHVIDRNMVLSAGGV
jgi:hypothetical protein